MTQPIALFSLLSCLSSTALAGELTLGEMGTAATIEEQDMVIHPLFNDSYVGLTEELQLRSCLICNRSVANAGVEYNLKREESRMMSIGGGLTYAYAGTAQVDTQFNYSTQAGDNWLTLGLGTGVAISNGTVATTGSPISLSYLILNEDSAWNFTATANPYSIYSTGVAIGVVSAKWHRAWEIFRLGVGINTFVGDIAIPVSDEAGETIDELKLPFIPLPALSFAWRI